MKPRVYLETTVIGYLTMWPSRDVVVAAHQQITRQWWQTQRSNYDLFVSQPVVQECGAGDPVASAERLKSMEGIPLLEVTPEVMSLAGQLMQQLAIPQRASLDAVHIAIAAVNGMDYLLTWNCTHIANAALRPIIDDACRLGGYDPPIICTPEELGDTAAGGSTIGLPS
jgi:hypothetical protein